MDKNILNEMIGQKLKTIRDARGLTLDQVAELTGVSKPMLGQIERARSNPTVSTLWRIAEGLGVPFTAFIEENEDDVSGVVKEAALEPIREDSGRYEVYPVFPLKAGRPFEIYTVTVQPGCRYEAAPHPAGVEEYLWCESGAVTIEADGGLNMTLTSRIGCFFEAGRGHTYINEGDAAARLVMVIYYKNN